MHSSNFSYSLLCTSAIALALALSCSREETFSERTAIAAGVPVSISLGAESISVETKSVFGSTDPRSLENLWVAQYDGIEEDAALTGVATYLTKEISYSTTNVEFSVNLVPMDHPSTIFFIANTYDRNFVFPATVSELVRKSKTLICEDDLFGNDGESSHFIFSGWTQPESIHIGDNFEATLKRNVAQINLHVTNSSPEGPDRVTVKGARLSSVPASSSYFPDYGEPEVFPKTVEKTISYSCQPWPLADGQDIGASSDFVFYAPVNKRGKVSNSQESQKCRFNPGCATYAVVECTYYDAVSEKELPIEYIFFLGANLTDDFNIECNRSYSFNLDIKSRGCSQSDPRITDYGTVDFTYPNVDRANCYILNPPTIDSYWRRFLIPLDKINTFWGLNTSIYEKNEEYCLTPESAWVAEVIWSDFTIDPSTNFRFAGGDDSMSGTGPGFFEVQIPKGVKGNVQVGVRRADMPDVYLWSWHLWITDYQPDDIEHYGLPADGKYDYAVANGMVHRLPGDVWTDGPLRKSYIMDRNLGALSTDYTSYNKPGCLFYEFGRKDPFWFPSGTSVEYQSPEVQDTDDFPTRSIQYSVKHPKEFIRRRDMTPYLPVWTLGNIYNPNNDNPNILWNDPYATPTNHQKSFFDPCPSGWKVPEYGVFEGLDSDNFIWSSQGRKFGKNCFFPASGFIASHYWGVSQNASYGLCLTSTPIDNSSEHALYFTSDHLDTQERDRRCYGFSVRCVKM